MKNFCVNIGGCRRFNQKERSVCDTSAMAFGADDIADTLTNIAGFPTVFSVDLSTAAATCAGNCRISTAQAAFFVVELMILVVAVLIGRLLPGICEANPFGIS